MQTLSRSQPQRPLASRESRSRYQWSSHGVLRWVRHGYGHLVSIRRAADGWHGRPNRWLGIQASAISFWRDSPVRTKMIQDLSITSRTKPKSAMHRLKFPRKLQQPMLYSSSLSTNWCLKYVRFDVHIDGGLEGLSILENAWKFDSSRLLSGTIRSCWWLNQKLSSFKIPKLMEGLA